MEFEVAVVAEEVGGADGVVGFGGLLGFVQEVGEGEVVLGGEGFHLVGVVLGVGGVVVGHDGEGGDAVFLEGGGVLDEAGDDCLDIGAVVADEGDEDAVFAYALGEGYWFAV